MVVFLCFFKEKKLQWLFGDSVPPSMGEVSFAETQFVKMDHDASDAISLDEALRHFSGRAPRPAVSEGWMILKRLFFLSDCCFPRCKCCSCHNRCSLFACC
jgi:hypothetical protein